MDTVEAKLARVTRNERIRILRENGFTWQRCAELAGVSGPGAAYTMACGAGYVSRSGRVEAEPVFWWTTVIPVHRRGFRPSPARRPARSASLALLSPGEPIQRLLRCSTAG